MEELQSWWEVPTIAHFCYVFRAAFNLFHFEIEELEAALLQMIDVEQPCATVEQLIMRLLQGCKKKAVNSENWEEVLRVQLGKYLQATAQADHHSSFLKDQQPFENLQLREKVDLLLTLCEMRLDADDVAEAIKGIESEALRIEPVGMDSEENTYWYFFGIRLYKETARKGNPVNEQKNKNTGRRRNSKPVINGASKGRANPRRRSRALAKEEEVQVTAPVWSVICHSLEDWNELSTSLRKSAAAKDRQLGKKILDQYIPDVSTVHLDRERLKRKRRVELGPIRTSARISVVRERQLAAAKENELRERERQKYTGSYMNIENDDQLDQSARRAAEKQRAIEERAKRAKLRELRLQESENSNSSDAFTRAFANQSHFQNGIKNFEDSSADDSDSSEPSENENSCKHSETVDSDNNASSDQDSSEEPDDSSEDDSGSDASFTIVPRKSPQYSIKHITKASSFKAPEQTVSKLPLSKTYSKPRSFQQTEGVQLNNRNVRASITYHNFNSFSVTKTPVFQRPAEQKFITLTQTPIISFVHVQDNANKDSTT